MFLYDIYHDQRILKEGIIPAELVLRSKGFRKEMIGFEPARQTIRPRVRHRSDSRRRGQVPASSRTTAGRRRASVTFSKTASS